MSDIKYWSSDAINNNASSPDGISANEPIKNIDNWGREVMAASKRAYLDREWIDNNHIPTYVSSNSFSVTTDLTAIYIINRRVRLIDSVGNIIYGTITGSSYSDPNTTITLALDSTQLNASINQVAYATVTNLSLNVYNKDEVYKKSEVDNELNTLNDVINGINGTLLNIQFFNTAGTHTYTKSEGVKKILVHVAGAGSGGSVYNEDNGNFFQGDNGGSSSFGSHCSATGGATTVQVWYGSSPILVHNTDGMGYNGSLNLRGKGSQFGYSIQWPSYPSPPDSYVFAGGTGGLSIEYITSNIGASETVIVGAGGAKPALTPSQLQSVNNYHAQDGDNGYVIVYEYT